MIVICTGTCFFPLMCLCSALWQFWGVSEGERSPFHVLFNKTDFLCPRLQLHTSHTHACMHAACSHTPLTHQLTLEVSSYLSMLCNFFPAVEQNRWSAKARSQFSANLFLNGLTYFLDPTGFYIFFYSFILVGVNEIWWRWSF